MEFVVVYVRDPHPGEPAYRKYVQPENMKQRKQYAKELADTRNMAATVVVDSIQDETYTLYGSLPNMVYVINRDGTIAYKATWAMADKIDPVLGAMTTEKPTQEPLSA